MNSQIWIYYTENTALNFHEDKNFIMEDLESYLSEKTKSIYFNDFMYLKIKLHLEIKVNLDQSYSHSLHTSPLHYVKIEQDGETYYYFIRDYEWISENAVRLVLHMDVLNTFQIGRDYDFGGETIIKRQHFDRWTPYIGTSGLNTLIAKVHLYPEGVNAPMYKKAEEVLYDDATDDENMYKNKYYLIYRNQEDPAQSVSSPVNVYCVSDNRFNVNSISYGDIYPSELREKTGLYFDSLSHFANILGTRYTFVCLAKASNSNLYAENMSVFKNVNTGACGHTATIYFISGTGSSATIDASYSYTFTDNFMLIKTIGATSVNLGVIVDGYAHAGLRNLNSQSTSAVFIELNSVSSAAVEYVDTNSLSADFEVKTSAFRSSTESSGYISGIGEIDRTDAKIVKIITLPYAPFNYTEEDGVVSPELSWERVTVTQDDNDFIALHLLSLQSLDRELDFKEDDDLVATNPANDIVWVHGNITTMLKAWATEPLFGGEWSEVYHDYFIRLESKLLHSESSYKKLVYDSFSVIMKYEDYDTDQIDLTQIEGTEYRIDLRQIKTRYVVTTSANLRVYSALYYKRRLQTEDYDGIMIISRNNDLPLYSSDYLTYLRTGYNYDVKSKNLSLQQNAISSFTSMFSIGNLTNPLSAVSSVARGVTNAVYSYLQSENSLAKTLAEKKASSESIDGSDDLDLLNAYTSENKFKVIKYEVRDELKDILMKYYQLLGYATNLYGAPDMESRTSFNYAEIEPDFEYFRYIDKECRDELESKWRGGVFRVHHFNDNWDDSLDLSNIETSIWDIVK